MWVWDGKTESQGGGNNKVDRVLTTCPTSQAPALNAQTAPELGLTEPADSYSTISLFALTLSVPLLLLPHSLIPQVLRRPKYKAERKTGPELISVSLCLAVK